MVNRVIADKMDDKSKGSFWNSRCIRMFVYYYPYIFCYKYTVIGLAMILTSDPGGGSVYYDCRVVSSPVVDCESPQSCVS